MMVKVELLELNDTCAIYKYFPEYETSLHGIISVDRQTLKRTIIKLAQGYTNEYAFQACREIERFINTNNFKETSVVAWY